MTRRPSRAFGAPLLLLALALPLVAARCPRFVAVPVAEGLALPVFAAAPAGDPRLFVVEQGGRIRTVDPLSGQVTSTFLDLSNRVSLLSDEGLWGLAFAPDYAAGGHFYVLYHDRQHRVVVSRFVAPDPTAGDADPTSEFVVLRVAMSSTSQRMATSLQFGPHDGMLYVALGDGGSSWSAQDLRVLRGKLLRLDVRGGARDPYAIPSDNPYAGANPAVTRQEIWAVGLHDPFRFDFDPLSGELWLGDVGVDLAHEIDRAPAGVAPLNFGWPVHEGRACVWSRPELGFPCEDPAAPVRFHFPFLEVPDGESCHVVGGAPYRHPWFQRLYVFSDRCSDRVLAIPDSGAGPDAIDVTGWLTEEGAAFDDVTAVARDGLGELHVVSRGNGRVYRLLVGYDTDGDGVNDARDNCVLSTNRDQADDDGDGVGNACDESEA